MCSVRLNTMKNTRVFGAIGYVVWEIYDIKFR